MHGAQAIAATHSARVQVQGVPVLRAGDRIVVAGCVAPASASACVALRMTGATRVWAEGQPVAIAVGAAAEGSGAPAHIVQVQARVLAI
ncbi:MAG: hypothetical protein ACOH1R_08265 [Luteimonas sp.]